MLTFLSINLSAPPSITSHVKKVTVMENENLTLHCNATGKPKPLVIWKKSGGASEETYFTDTLRIPQVNRNDSGAYECIAVNAAGETSSITHIDVFCK